jgi:hypothetical protein
MSPEPPLHAAVPKIRCFQQEAAQNSSFPNAEHNFRHQKHVNFIQLCRYRTNFLRRGLHNATDFYEKSLIRLEQ